MKKKPEKKNNGSALLIALVIMMVVMMLSLALLLVSYSLRMTSIRQGNTEQCKELAQSLSKEIGAEITVEPTNTYSDNATQDNKVTPLWFYLRYNVWQTKWPYYNKREPRHGSEYAYRYFKPDRDLKGVDDISILMYWESDEEMIKEVGTETDLTVRVTCAKGKQKSVITSTYSLTIDEFVEGEAETTVKPSSAYNPSGNGIAPNEKWSWTLSDEGEEGGGPV